MSTLIKKARFSVPPPQEAPPPIVRHYTTQVQEPQYGQVPVFVKSEADIILYPKVNAAMVKVLGAGSDSYYVNNWFKRVIQGFATQTVDHREVIEQPRPPQPQPTPVPDAWDATARSIKAYADPVRTTFTLGAGSRGAVVAGLTFLRERAHQAPSYITHGFKVEAGIAYVQTSPGGLAQAEGAETQVLMPAKAVAPGDVLRIDVVAGQVSHYVNDALMARTPSRLGSYPVHLSAALFSSADSIVAPTLEPLALTARGQAGLRLLALGSSEPYAAGHARLRLRAQGNQSSNGVKLRLFAAGTSGEPGYGTLRLPRLRATGFGLVGATASGRARLFRRAASLGSDTAYSGGRAGLRLLTMVGAEDFPSEVIAVAAGRLQLLESTAAYPHRGLYGSAAAEVQFDAVISPADRLRTAGALRWTPRASLRVLATLLTKAGVHTALGDQRISDAALVVPGVLGAPLMGLLLVSERLDVAAQGGIELQGGRSVSEVLATQAQITDALQAEQVLQAALRALGHIGVQMGEPGKNVSVWSVNTATGASSAYEDFPFNSFASIGGKNYGATTDGIYALEGDDDAGSPIQAHVHLGDRDFGTSRLKALPHAYLGVSSQGQMLLRVTAGANTYTYRARSAGVDMQTQRIDLGRGLRANYITLELLNEGGADFDLDSIEFTVLDLSRRI